VVAKTTGIHIEEQLSRYQDQVETELESILSWWIKYMPDEDGSGFNGEVNNDNTVVQQAAKGLVLNSRILWTFSAAFMHSGKTEYLPMAGRAFRYLSTYFLDEAYGGMFWSVDAAGNKLMDKKQVYGIAFCIYGLSEYYRAAQIELSLQMAKDLFYLLEKHSLDTTYGGYLEAFTCSWEPIDDLRLSDKDDNEKKTMNTHLHVLEAYSNLYKVWKDEQLAKAIVNLLNIFSEKIINPITNQQQLFFTEEWEPRSAVVSFGHDIEAAWLLHEAAATLGNAATVQQFEKMAIQMADAALAAIDKDGGLWYELNTTTNHLNKEKHWWPQAEAMVGFFNAYQITGNLKYLEASQNSWTFIQQYLLNKEFGEWNWGIHADGSIMQKEKAGFWKCPYHNSRACMEISERIG